MLAPEIVTLHLAWTYMPERGIDGTGLMRCAGAILLCDCVLCWQATVLSLTESAHLREGVQQEDGLAPGGIDLVPVHGHGGGATEAEARDGGEGAVVPDVERIVVHVGAPQPVQVR